VAAQVRVGAAFVIRDRMAAQTSNSKNASTFLTCKGVGTARFYDSGRGFLIKYLTQQRATAALIVQVFQI
jgi:hypothetical protein